MFRKRCKKCDKKVSKSFDFCPYCGIPMKNQEDYGLLGKNDNLEELNNLIRPKSQEFGGFSGSIIEKMLGKAFKMLESEIRTLNQEENQMRPKQNLPPMKTDFQLYINGKKVNLPEFQEKIAHAPKEKIQTQKLPEISQATLEKSKKLPRKEAKSKVTRHKEKVVYELDTPGLETINNVLVNKLENAIEIKAYTNKAVYFKTLPIRLPLMQYSIKEGKLFLEFKT